MWTSSARHQAPAQRGATATAAAAASSATRSSSTWVGPRQLWAPHQQSRASSVAAASSSDAAAAMPLSSANTPAAPSFTTHSYLWRGYKCKYATAGCGPAVLLVHGFGASSRHWRRNIGALADAGYKVRLARNLHWRQRDDWALVPSLAHCTASLSGKQGLFSAGHLQGCAAPNLTKHAPRIRLPSQVYAVDLLGQGGSEKPIIDYSMELWRDQLLDFLAEHIQARGGLVPDSLPSPKGRGHGLVAQPWQTWEAAQLRACLWRPAGTRPDLHCLTARARPASGTPATARCCMPERSSRYPVQHVHSPAGALCRPILLNAVALGASWTGLHHSLLTLPGCCPPTHTHTHTPPPPPIPTPPCPN